MRIILAGFVLVTVTAALVAWFGNPPIADTIFNIAVVLIGVGVLGGTIGIMVSGRWRGE